MENGANIYPKEGKEGFGQEKDPTEMSETFLENMKVPEKTFTSKRKDREKPPPTKRGNTPGDTWWEKLA